MRKKTTSAAVAAAATTAHATVLFEYLEYLKLKGPWDRRLTLIEFVNSFSINEPFGGGGWLVLLLLFFPICFLSNSHSLVYIKWANKKVEKNRQSSVDDLSRSTHFRSLFLDFFPPFSSSLAKIKVFFLAIFRFGTGNGKCNQQRNKT